MAAVLFVLVLSWDGTTEEAAGGGKPSVPIYPPAVPLIGGNEAFKILGGIALPDQIRKSKERVYPLPETVFGCLKLSV
jgi:hypothetical protein